ncbi:MAG: hypothetical protein NZ888_06520 [Candidatus Nitrosocaldus sp.]|nr:hypothetical protein [Candidatus Nitrosocaldus sp.]MDW8000527.1 hypothetical protein [Candidatus Nitrosocaldus sp.]
MDACELHADITVSSVYYNGSSRQNPDGTYYPGDAFAYRVEHWYGTAPYGSCIDYSYWLEVGSDATRYGSSTSGVIEISDGARIGQHTIRFHQSIVHLICIPLGEDSICYKLRYSKSTSYTYTVADPAFRVHLSKIQLMDGDGFMAMNRDGTYYIGDPIAILHTSHYRFKDERIGTLRVVVEREYDDMHIAYEYNCMRESCDHRVGYEEYSSTVDLGYGDGVTLYDTSRSSPSTHTIVYTIRLINIDKVIATSSVSIDVKIVRYIPVYHHYVYLMLNDDAPWSYNKSIAIALHYHGSRDDHDDTLIHPLRRSKINHYEHYIYMNHDMQVTHLTLDGVDAHGFNADTGAVLFEHAGYGKIVFSPVIEDDIRLPLYNLTLVTRLYSINFAGHDTMEVINTEYVYPLVRFSTSIEVTVYGSDGNIRYLPIEVEMHPLYGYLHDYIRSKVLHDTQHEMFAEMVIGDMYPRENHATGYGHMRMQVNYTSHHIPAYVLARYALLDIPLHIALDTLTPYRLKITAGDTMHVYDEYTFSFYRDYRIVINMDRDNRIEDISLVDGKIVFDVGERFGEVTGIVVNGVSYDPQRYCSSACMIPFHGRSAMVEVFNGWGGRAYAEVSDGSSDGGKKDGHGNYRALDRYVGEFLLVGTLALTLFTAYTILVGRRKHDM